MPWESRYRNSSFRWRHDREKRFAGRGGDEVGVVLRRELVPERACWPHRSAVRRRPGGTGRGSHIDSRGPCRSGVSRDAIIACHLHNRA